MFRTHAAFGSSAMSATKPDTPKALKQTEKIHCLSASTSILTIVLSLSGYSPDCSFVFLLVPYLKNYLSFRAKRRISVSPRMVLLFLFNDFFNIFFCHIKPLPKNNSYQFGKVYVISFRFQNVAHNGRKFNEANKQARPLINNATTICSHIHHRHHHHKSEVTHNLSDRSSASR